MFRLGIRSFAIVIFTFIFLMTGQALCAENDTSGLDQQVGAAETQNQAKQDTVVNTPESLSSVTNGRQPGQKYIDLYQGGTFIGNEPLKRRELLTVLNRLLNDIDDGKIFVQSSDIEVLRKVVNDYRDELVRINSELDKISEELVLRAKKDESLSEDITKVAEKGVDLKDQLLQYADDLKQSVDEKSKEDALAIDGMLSDIDSVKDEILKVKNELYSLESDLYTMLQTVKVQNEDSVNELRDYAEENIANLKQSIDDLARQLEIHEVESASAMQKRDSKIEELETKLKDLEDRMAVLEAQNRQYQSDMKAIKETVLEKLKSMDAQSIKDIEQSASDKDMEGLKRDVDTLKPLLAILALLVGVK